MVLWICPNCGTAYDAERVCPVCLTADELRAAIGEVVSAYYELVVAEAHDPAPEIAQTKDALIEEHRRLEATLRAVTGEPGAAVPPLPPAVHPSNWLVSKVLRK